MAKRKKHTQQNRTECPSARAKQTLSHEICIRELANWRNMRMSRPELDIRIANIFIGYPIYEELALRLLYSIRDEPV